MLVHRRSIVLAALLAISACSDRAKPDYDRCVAAHDAGQIEAAQRSCQAAVAADPKSEDGIAASTWLQTINPEVDRAREQARLVAEQQQAAMKLQQDAEQKEALIAAERASLPGVSDKIIAALHDCARIAAEVRATRPNYKCCWETECSHKQSKFLRSLHMIDDYAGVLLERGSNRAYQALIARINEDNLHTPEWFRNCSN